jgi:Ca2+-binding RTX toxin-like protein
MVKCGGGNDKVDGTDTNAPLWADGGAGNDTRIGGAAGDTLYGRAGTDNLQGKGEGVCAAQASEPDTHASSPTTRSSNHRSPDVTPGRSGDGRDDRQKGAVTWARAGTEAERQAPPGPSMVS